MPRPARRSGTTSLRGLGPRDLYVNVPARVTIRVVLEWNDGWGASGNDYDLWLYRTDTGAWLTSSRTTQDGNDNPVEAFGWENTGSTTVLVGIAVEQYRGVARNLEVYIYGGTPLPNNLVAADSIFGHSAVPHAIAVGAIDSADAGHDTIEDFSSRGPATVDGVGRPKPDVTGIDGVSVTGAGGFSTDFYGTRIGPGSGRRRRAHLERHL